jgi:hypothetical protein
MFTVGILSGPGGGNGGLVPVCALVGKVALTPQPASASSSAIAKHAHSKRNMPRRACDALTCPAWTVISFIIVRHRTVAINAA